MHILCSFNLLLSGDRHIHIGLYNCYSPVKSILHTILLIYLVAEFISNCIIMMLTWRTIVKQLIRKRKHIH